jgi:hypothetical protein
MKQPIRVERQEVLAVQLHRVLERAFEEAHIVERVRFRLERHDRRHFHPALPPRGGSPISLQPHG